MPNYGENQKPAGVKLNTAPPPFGKKTMKSNMTNVIPTLKSIDNVPYKGNAVLNANA